MEAAGIRENQGSLRSADDVSDPRERSYGEWPAVDFLSYQNANMSRRKHSPYSRNAKVAGVSIGH